MKKAGITGTFLVLLLLFLFSWPTRVQASEMLTKLGGNPAEVGPGQRVDTVVAVGTDARIAGWVKDIVLVVNGNVVLAPSARVDLVIDLGGHVTNLASEKVKTGVFEVNPTPGVTQELLFGALLLVGTWLVRLIASLAGILLLTGLGYALDRHFERAAAFLAHAPGRLFAIGVAGALVSWALTVLLSLTIIGIPVAVLVFFLSLLAAFLGILPLIDYLGREFLNARVQTYPPITRRLVLASLFTALINIPLLGFFLLLIFGAVGFGLTTVLLWSFFKERKSGRLT
ncbi:Hypothetical protein DEACI_1196 [Acididesulfobacillus acetoxydans]|uniref:Uncharacterized protein n=1 Tax=Acididesulfobacillus acetoxydans TaxID=1561005 RepID=A0A8S0VW83_9FIRM|nr:hypothetical protein [Acididesulfobacillus acetoxydans]CAA7600543.1 Hypothetical protein DEACI_1196 [Acididesulfobacillus acetoxydans]CEJ06677.1 Hypothetical protein DEACI_1126 [Acididesulfobacillus acetoxydans]